MLVLYKVVNQQIRFVLGDEHWNELKKLRPIGIVSVVRTGVAAVVRINA